MGSSSGPSANGTYYTHNSWYNGDEDEYGEVQIRSKRVKKALGLGVHHLVRFSMPSYSKRKWAIFEWLGDGSNFYACDNISTNYCLSLGNHYLRDVYIAAVQASNGHRYSTNYNCNHWTENFARHLGHNITVHWNCSCVL